MLGPIRVLPVLIFSLLIMLGMNVVQLWSGVNAAGRAIAADSSAKKPAASKENHDSANDKAAAGHGIAGATDKAVPGLAPDAHAAEAAAHGGNAHAAGADHAGAPAAPAVERPRIPGEEDFISASEIGVLESLTERRKTLEKRQAELDMREKLLIATEKRLDEKLAEVKRIETEIKASIQTMDERELAQITSLVKVYETMKPKEAAEILQGLDREVLLEVAARMKEAKMSAILAAMDPKRAREVTVMLVERNSLPSASGVTAANGS